MKVSITVASRKSPLAQAQVEEVMSALAKHHQKVDFLTVSTDTKGDCDLKTSLRTLGKTDFFTQEVDDLVLSHVCKVAIHSAKDLPEHLPSGLQIVAITQGIDPSDSLVMRPGKSLYTLQTGSKIATSSERREQVVKSLRQDLTFVDIRGSVDQRLAKLESGEIDGLVVAEAALIRLKLTHHNRMKLPGDTTPGQGQLAIVARRRDHEMEALFACIDSRKT